jgi:hypothetical protein
MTHSNEALLVGKMDNWEPLSLLSEFWNVFTLGTQGTVAASLACVHRLSSTLSLDGCVCSLLVMILQGVIRQEAETESAHFPPSTCSFTLLLAPNIHFLYSINHCLMRKTYTILVM